MKKIDIVVKKIVEDHGMFDEDEYYELAEAIVEEIAEFVGKQCNDIPCTGEEMANGIRYYYGSE